MTTEIRKRAFRLRRRPGAPRDSHLAVCAVNGLDPVQMNLLTELWCGYPLGAYTASRGWTSEQVEGAADGLRQRGLLDGDVHGAGACVTAPIRRHARTRCSGR